MLTKRKKALQQLCSGGGRSWVGRGWGECSAMMIGGQGSAVVQDTIAATTIARWSRVIYKPDKGRNAPN